MAADWLKTALRLFRNAARMDLLWLLRDTKTALLVITTDVVTTLSSLAGILLLSARYDGIGGMTGDQVLFMLGYATCVDGLFMTFFAMNNTGHISRVIGRGQYPALPDRRPRLSRHPAELFLPHRFLCVLCAKSRRGGLFLRQWFLPGYEAVPARRIAENPADGVLH